MLIVKPNWKRCIITPSFLLIQLHLIKMLDKKNVQVHDFENSNFKASVSMSLNREQNTVMLESNLKKKKCQRLFHLHSPHG